MRRDEDPNEPGPAGAGEEEDTPPTGQEADSDSGDDQEAMEPDLGSAG
ncbi:hypothetical protein BH24ACT26_BH24ACT26_22610 [soil metagenome]